MSTTSGKALKVTFNVGNTVVLGVTNSDVTDVADELDATDSDSAPFTSTDIGCTGLKVQIKGNHRVDGNIFIGLKCGTAITNVKIYPHGLTTPAWVMPLAICLAGSYSAVIRGKCEYTINIASQGTFSTPDV